MDGSCRSLQGMADWLHVLRARRDSPLVFFLAVLVVILNLADAVFTDFILAHGGWEVNPIARAAIAAFGDSFWIWKYAVVSLSVLLLSGFVHVRLAKVCLGLAAVLYGAVTVWHLILIDSLYPLL
ncbi:MAG: DUF5658 family protein [Pseudomonadota bacterium]|nr:hypothetical protein [Syntrophaceae bacterium]MDI9555221.1 DUF5658 family protein [Pseudomonadota bacterium]NLX32519.1 hypothetical protein [Deltaproteobacteria bacterium]HNU85466.1 DUF5658 family protein [Syntrophales bacterium]HNZ35085.1 DUF5658 family protein [Syntrophales bacterium]